MVGLEVLAAVVFYIGFKLLTGNRDQEKGKEITTQTLLPCSTDSQFGHFNYF
jgi:hypothetical protein